jgi:Protein of unknown function (DUF2281)
MFKFELKFKEMKSISITKFYNLKSDLRQEVLDFIDFLLEKQKKQANSLQKRPSNFGSAKGEVVMSDDFNEPLDEFKEYML